MASQQATHGEGMPSGVAVTGPMFTLELRDSWQAAKTEALAEWHFLIRPERAATLPEPGIIWFKRVEDPRGTREAAPAAYPSDDAECARQVRAALVAGGRSRCVRVEAPKS